MNIIPAIDLQNGLCVRLTQGVFDTPTIYNADPKEQARAFARMGARRLHVVDLDGARAGAPRQIDLIIDIAKASGLETQVGGGIRDDQTVKQLFDGGIARVVIGSLAVKDPARVNRWLAAYGPARIVLAFDIKLDDGSVPRVLTNGWQDASPQSLWDVLDLYAAYYPKTVLCTDVARDGMLQGPNLDLYATMRRERPRLNVIASGGVADLSDLKKLAALSVDGVVVGKAIYEGRIDLAVAVREAADAR